MKKVIILLIISILLFSISPLYSSIGEAGDINARTLYVGGTGNSNYSNIQEAIYGTNEGDTIFVYNGTYYERILINKSIKLIGENKNSTIINGNEQGSVVRIRSDNVEISDLTITNGGYDTSGRRAIEIYDSDNAIITNNIISFTYRGLFIYSSNNNLIYRNIFKNNNGTSILISFSNFNDILDNEIINSNAGLAIDYSNSNNITNNIIQFNKQIGLKVSKSKNNMISENLIRNNSWRGIEMGNSSHNTIQNNNISNNADWGISLSDNSNNNSIYHNNFLKNTPGHATDTHNNIYYNTTLKEGNYWDDYIGNDTNDDGIGDKPYNISYGNNQDNFPLINPCGSEIIEKPGVEGIDTSFIYPMLIIGLIISIIFCIPIALYWRKRYYS